MNVPSQMRRERRANSGDAGLSASGNADLLVKEAELAAEGRAENYHVPSDESVLGQVQARCEQNDLEPAWTVVDGIN